MIFVSAGTTWCRANRLRRFLVPVSALQIRSKPDGLEFGAYFLLGFNGLGIIVSNSTHSPPDSDRSALFWWRSEMITSTLPRAVNRCVALFSVTYADGCSCVGEDPP